MLIRHRGYPIIHNSTDHIITVLDCDGSDEVIGQFADFDLAKAYVDRLVLVIDSRKESA